METYRRTNEHILTFCAATIFVAGCGGGETELAFRHPGAKHSAVIDGQASGPGDFPPSGALVGADGIFCTGTLIAPNVVLTAAHCVDGMPAAAFFTLALDVTGVRPEAMPPQSGRLARTIVHPDYVGFDDPCSGQPAPNVAAACARLAECTQLVDASFPIATQECGSKHPGCDVETGLPRGACDPFWECVMGHPKVLEANACMDGLSPEDRRLLGLTELDRDPDLALALLDTPIADVTPARLPTAADTARITNGLGVSVVGYGIRSLEDAGQMGIKYHATLTIDEVGEWLLRQRREGQEPTTCSGDSGGPVFIQGADAASLVQIGVTSAGSGEGPVPCGVDSVFVRVDGYLPWIQESLHALSNPGGDTGAVDDSSKRRKKSGCAAAGGSSLLWTLALPALLRAGRRRVKPLLVLGDARGATSCHRHGSAGSRPQRY